MKKIVLLIAIILGLVGCSSPSPEPEGPVTLKVLVWNEELFYDRYGKYFIAVHPDYELDIVSVLDHMERSGDNVNDVLDQLLKRERPDVLVVPMNEYALLREQGQLSALSIWIVRDELLDVQSFAPAVMNYLQDDQEEVHGLAPVFTGRALYMNKQLFANEGIPLPTDRLTWEEVFALAQRFADSGGDEVIGLYHHRAENPYLMSLYVGEGSGLSLYQDDAFTLHTEAWTQVFESVTACLRSGACSDGQQSENNDRLNREAVEQSNMPFLTGNFAMAVDDSTLYRTLMTEPERYSHLEWAVVPLPTSAAHPDLGNVVQMHDVFALPADAPQAAQGWELIRYVSSEEYAKLLPQLNPIALPVRVPDEQNDGLSAFYELERTVNGMAESLRKLPYDVLIRMDELSPTYMEAMSSGRMTVTDALEELEAELQTTYDAAKTE